MATTTPNFGWPVPTSTDLVKDGATAIEALGDSIDASLLDLKGGTTGQVLSKNSNTDMDFTWVTDAAGDITGVTAGTGISGGGTSGTVTVTNSMATAIDAKGDLVVGTGADTFARLGVGTNGQTLVADSAEATGLKWGAASAGALTLITTQTLSGVTSQSINSCFSATYQNYLIVFSAYCATSANLPTLKLRASGTDSSAGYYSSFLAHSFANSAQSDGQANQSSWGSRPLGQLNTSTTDVTGINMTVYSPFEAKNTTYSGNYSNPGTSGASGTTGGIHNSAVSYDGFTITNATAMTGTVRVYGMAN